MKAIPPQIRSRLALVGLDYVEQHMQRTEAHLGAVCAEKLAADLKRLFSVLPSGLPELVRASLLYDMLRFNIIYDHGTNVLRYTYVGAFYRRKAVCMGIAELFALLCEQYGLCCKVVIGYAGASGPGGGDLHAWNLLCLHDAQGGERWFACDLTWDLSRKTRPRDRRYFLKDDDYMRDHDHYWDPARYPACEHSQAEIPELPKKGVDLACRIYKEVTRSAS